MLTIHGIDLNQLYPVTSAFGEQVFFSLERAAAPYFGIKVRMFFIFSRSCYLSCF